MCSSGVLENKFFLDQIRHFNQSSEIYDEDIDVIINILAKHPHYILHVREDKMTPLFCLKLVEQDPISIARLHGKQQSEDVCMEALKATTALLSFIEKENITEKMLKYVFEKNPWQAATFEYKDLISEDMWKSIVRKDPYLIEFAPMTYGIIKEALDTKHNAICLIPEKYLKNYLDEKYKEE
jgi:hypothetical protein